jgi:DNA-directed RNA polymerase subunit beta'
MLRTTVGQLLINEALPPDLRDYDRVLDKKTIRQLLNQVAEKHPEKYNEIADALMKIGAEEATVHGREASISLDDLRISEPARKLREALRKGVQTILQRKDMTQEQKDEKIEWLIGKHSKEIRETDFKEQLANRNAMAMQVNSGARGNPIQFSAITVGDLLVQDHKDRPIPIPILHAYAEGLDPVEYWAGSYGARRGSIDTKMATPRSGFLAKQLALASHRLTITEHDCGTTNGIPAAGSDPDNEGAVLARNEMGLKAGKILDSKDLKILKPLSEIIVRSPLTCQAKGGVCAKCAGVREKGKLPEIGEHVGLAAASAISEPISQSSLSSKHSGGIVGAGPTASGFEAINMLTQVPKTFQGGATIATTEGRVERIEKAPQGGSFVTIGGVRHYVAPNLNVKVSKGDVIEPGDVISEGIPNPAELVRQKGIGAGRWHFVKVFGDTLKASKIAANRRNIELLARGLINHVRITDPDGPPDTLPDDVIEFDSMTRGYTPRTGFRQLPPKQAVGMYLEAPYMQYSIGTKITPRIAKELTDRATKQIIVHQEHPSFIPEMVRAMETLGHSEDWMVRLGGFHLKKNLLESVHRGLGSTERGTSYIPALARGTELGKAPGGAK